MISILPACLAFHAATCAALRHMLMLNPTLSFVARVVLLPGRHEREPTAVQERSHLREHHACT